MTQVSRDSRTKLGTVFRVVGGGTPSTQTTKYWNGEIPWISSADIDDRHKITPRKRVTREAIESSATNLVPKGSVIVVTRVGLGKVAEAPTDLCFSQDCQALLFDHEMIDPRFVVHQLSRSTQIFNHVSRGTTISGVTKKQLLDLDFWLPPLPKQRRIVAEIEEQLTRVEAGVAALKRVQANLTRYKSAVLRAAVEGRLVPTEAELARREWRSYETGEQLLKCILEARRALWKGKGKYKKPSAPDTTELRELPEGWAYTTAEQLTDENRPITYGVIKLGDSVDGGIPVLRSSDVRQLQIELERVKRISLGIAARYRRTFLRGGEIVVTVRGTLGGIAVVPSQCNGYNVSREVAMLALIEPAMGEIVSFFIASGPVNHWLMRHTKGIAYTGINIETLKALPLPIPPLAEQRRIVAEIERRLSLVREVDAQVDASFKQAQALGQSILAAAFDGRLVSN
jgi:type I restriction enzyme, S subunit